MIHKSMHLSTIGLLLSSKTVEMEAAATALIQLSPGITVAPQCSTFPSHYFSTFTKKKLFQVKAREFRNFKPLKAAAAASEATPPDSEQRWLLEPIGDGDTRHIGFKVPLPNAFEIASNVVTVGRLPQKADIVIPIATVSGLHARLEKKEGTLLVTDLDSTNGTFVDKKRLRPGTLAAVPPGSCLTFGDVHLAMFRVSKLDKVDAPSEPDEAEPKTDGPSDSVAASS